MAKPRAFSLVELMLVVAMIGVMAAIAVPQIANSIRRANAAVQAVRVQSYLAEARNLARRTNQCVKVTRSADGAQLAMATFSTCAITDDCHCRASAQPATSTTLDLSAVTPKDATVSALVGSTSTLVDLTGHAGPSTLIFLADGSTPYATPITFSVVVPGANTTDLKVLPGAGVVRIVLAGE